MSYARSTPAGSTEDVAQIGFDVANVTNSAWDSSWTFGDHQTVHNALFAFDAAWKSMRTSTCSLTSIKAYPRAFADPMTLEKRFATGGPPTWNSAQAVVGTNATNPLPYQVAMSVTLKNAFPRHWGRVYIPGLTEDATTSNGRWDQADMQTMEGAAAVLLQTLWDADFPIVTASTQYDNQLVGQLLGVTSIQVDDIPDVIRRRRPRQVAIREITSLA